MKREPSKTPSAIRSKRLREEKKAKGVCVQSGCWNPSRPGKVRCEFHGKVENL